MPRRTARKGRHWAPVVLFAVAVACIVTAEILAGLHVRYAGDAQAAAVIAAAILIAAGLVIACTGGRS
jgi:hypothetical protein